MAVKGLCLGGHRQVHRHGNSGKVAVPACSAGGYGSEGPLFGRAQASPPSWKQWQGGCTCMFSRWVWQ